MMLVLPVSHWDGWLVISWDQLSNETIICFFVPKIWENLNYVFFFFQICIARTKDSKPETMLIMLYLFQINIFLPLIKYYQSKMSQKREQESQRYKLTSTYKHADWIICNMFSSIWVQPIPKDFLGLRKNKTKQTQNKTNTINQTPHPPWTKWQSNQKCYGAVYLI